MKMFKKSLALLFALLLCCSTLCYVYADYGDNDVTDDFDGEVVEPEEPDVPPAPTYYSGDADGNGKVDNDDLGIILNFFLLKLNEADFTANNYVLSTLNVDGNDSIDNDDLGIILNFFLLKLSDEEAAEYGFPV